MKVGILTFHSQINYGGVLQAFALRETLAGMGHEAFLIDRRPDAENSLLLGPFAVHNPFKWVDILLAAAFGYGMGAHLRRILRTIRFVRRRLNRTPYHFVSWGELAGRDLGLERIVVGSDQVWNPAFAGLDTFLLADAEITLPPLVSYAASIGAPTLSAEVQARFRKGLPRFAAISVREARAQELLAGLGFEATLVLDPTQLLPAARWRACFGLPERGGAGARPRLVCYFMDGYLSDTCLERLERLEAFAREAGCDVTVLLENWVMPKFRRKRRVLRDNARRVARARALRRVKVLNGAGPEDFLRAFAQADWCVTDSFHALQFSSIFGLDARFLRPAAEGLRKDMFTRITSFAEDFARGPLIQDGLPAALASLAAGERVAFDEAALEAGRARSRAWLAEALAKAAP